ncbi:hypothetical protein SNOG_14582 [Parastagonospora nodorum SN15]|uniref:Uncharacterized protein n=1 Tax=Phaeosphaeria nodorum (strain SN15 / ATCC MYA-4574 / FGSC 10173) TaxID=321614 RepID=Q0U169_PHANO|nr:hypothetical protein SNOG_14582 [Parastagonospora nodorum SN15]EAT78122.2 hypothetical protein SNOG_14582 [Parastagonospora nodorum SN15]
MSKSRDEWEEKAGEARKAAKNVQALQNTIDHLEDRLEIANMERLDAQEQLFIIQAQKSPFDFRHPSLDLPPATDHEQDKIKFDRRMQKFKIWKDQEKSYSKVTIRLNGNIRALERQLEYHKLLLQAQIRRHATMTLHAATSDNPLPELSKLTKREDIDRWIEQLQERLKKEKLMAIEHRTLDPIEARVADLRQEIDFYVREIIYYKLDIRGYKGDIRKLKKVTAQLSSFASRAFVQGTSD